MSLWSGCHCLKYQGSCGRHCILKTCVCRMSVVCLYTKLPLVRAQIFSWCLYSSGFPIPSLSTCGRSPLPAATGLLEKRNVAVAGARSAHGSWQLALGHCPSGLISSKVWLIKIILALVLCHTANCPRVF